MATPAARTTFAAVPPEAADVLRPALPGLADEMIVAISAEVPDYARAMEGTFGQLVRMGVEVALNRFMDLVAEPRSDATPARDTYVNLGRGEFHAGRSLDALLAAYRVGARLAWRRFVEAGTAARLPPEVLYSLGEAIFAYIDEISAESADGYAEEQSAAAGESQRRRRRLVRLLAQHPPASQEAVRTAAQAAAWPLPRRVAALVCAEAETAAGADAAGEPPGGARGEAVPGEEIVEADGIRLARRL
ncbi:MAG: PucR family transcriptional regulator, partial [Solirubrobacteraceae bacterium]